MEEWLTGGGKAATSLVFWIERDRPVWCTENRHSFSIVSVKPRASCCAP